MNHNLIMAIDPGIRSLGLAVATAEGRLLATEVLTTQIRMPFPNRVKAMEVSLKERFSRFSPNILLLEKTWPTSSKSLAAGRRASLICRRLADSRRIPLMEVAVKEIRKKVVGWGWATKAQTAQVVASLYPELQIYLRQDRAWKERHFQNLFDAVALLVYERKTRVQATKPFSSPES